jgi:hypothetical protein
VSIDVNPYESSARSSRSGETHIVDAETLNIMRKPGFAMAIQGWILAAVYLICLLVILLIGEWRDLLEMGIPFLIAFVLAIQLARCGLCTMRFESRRMTYIGILLSVLLFLPLGIFICTWIAISLNRIEILNERKRNIVDR